MLLCFGCGRRQWQIPGQPITEEEKKVWKRGYYLCPVCEMKDESPKEYWMPWTHFDIIGGEIYDKKGIE
jgi:hypothetical protein